jgi:hypothetical protein
MVERTASAKFRLPRRQTTVIKIRNPKLEIRNKPKPAKPKFKIQNGRVWNFLLFYQLNLFRISDLGFDALSS